MCTRMVCAGLKIMSVLRNVNSFTGKKGGLFQVVGAILIHHIINSSEDWAYKK